MFGKLFGFGGTKSGKSGALKLSSAIAGKIQQFVGAGGIPAMPGAAQKAFKLSTDPNAEARDYIDVIESDEALSARIIKIANSVFFDRGKRSKTIEESVTVIGINELRCLLNATTLSEIFPSNNPLRAQFWAHDVATGLTARALAQRLAPSKAESIFLGGLMHDIGKLLILQRSGSDYQKVVEHAARTGLSFCAAEEEILFFNHTEVGQLIAEKWNFTPELTEMIRDHHRSWDLLVTGGTPSATAIVKAADIIAHSAGLGHGKDLARFRKRAEDELDECWEAISFPNNDRKDFVSRCANTFESEYDLYSGKSA